MAYKIQIENNFFVLSDTVTGAEIIREVRDQVKFSVASTVYRFKWNYANSPDVSKEIVTEFDFANIVDSALTPFADQATLNAYLSSKIGKICCNPSDIDIDITDSASTTLYLLTVAVGGSATQPIQDCTVENSDSSYTDSILAEGNLVLPDITVTDSDGSTSSFPSVKDVTCTPSPDTTLEVNGTTEGTFTAGSTIDVQLSDSGGVVTPTSVTVVGSDVQVLLPDAPPVSYKGTALPMKTGQDVVHVANDDGATQYGRQISWYQLSANNYFGHDRRFTGITGGYHNGTGYVSVNGTASTYAAQFPNNVIIDWDTYDEATGNFLMYYNVVAGNQNWNNARLSAIALSIGAFTSGWHMCNFIEFYNVRKMGFDNGVNMFNYPPFSGNTSNGIAIANHVFWTANTANATNAVFVYNYVYNVGLIDPVGGAAKFFACRIGNISEL